MEEGVSKASVGKKQVAQDNREVQGRPWEEIVDRQEHRRSHCIG